MAVTGAYYPEISAAAVQVKTAAAALRGKAQVSVLTTAVDTGLPAIEMIDEVHVYRVPIDVSSAKSKSVAAIQLSAHLFGARGSFDVIHLHGFSQKNVPVMMAARALGKPVVMTLHTAGQDEADVVRQRGVLARWAFRSPDRILAVSPALAEAWIDAGLPGNRLQIAPNGIDTKRFAPAGEQERERIRTSFGWPADQRVVLFVGFFSRDKRPDLLFRAWTRIRQAGSTARLVFVGATGSPYYEIDRTLAGEIRRSAADTGLADDVVFAEATLDVHRYMQAADVYVLPSVREAHPLALLEAMSTGVASIATRLAGATDGMIDDGVNGRLFRADDERALAEALWAMLANPGESRNLGARGRETVLARYDIRNTSEAWLSAYRAVLSRSS